MNRTVPPFNPPSRDRNAHPDFKTYFDRLNGWLDRYTDYVKNYMTNLLAVVNTNTQGFSLTDIASDTIIQVGAYISNVTGTTTVSVIETSPGFSGQVLLIAQDGFSTDTFGNISAAVTVAAGQALILNYSPVTQVWYPVVVGAVPPIGNIRSGSQAATLGSATVSITFGSPLPLPYTALVSLDSNVDTTVTIVDGTETINGFDALLGFTPGIGDTITVNYAAFG